MTWRKNRDECGSEVRREVGRPEIAQMESARRVQQEQAVFVVPSQSQCKVVSARACRFCSLWPNVHVATVHYCAPLNGIMCCRRCGPNPRLRSAGGRTSVAMPHTVNAGGPDEALHDMLTQSVSNGMVWYGRAKECRWIGGREGKSSCSTLPAGQRDLVL